jgi:hypothetical protein
MAPRGTYKRSTETRLKQSTAAKEAWKARRPAQLPHAERLARRLRIAAGRHNETI